MTRLCLWHVERPGQTQNLHERSSIADFYCHSCPLTLRKFDSTVPSVTLTVSISHQFYKNSFFHFWLKKKSLVMFLSRLKWLEAPDHDLAWSLLSIRFCGFRNMCVVPILKKLYEFIWEIIFGFLQHWRFVMILIFAVF